MTKISQLSSIGDSLAIDDQFIIRDVSDVSTPNKSVTISGIARALDLGSAAAPAIAFASDKNSGLYSPGADQVAISTGGTVKATVDSSGRLLVGTSSHSGDEKLVVNGSSKVGDVVTRSLNFAAVGASTGTADITMPANYAGFLVVQNRRADDAFPATYKTYSVFAQGTNTSFQQVHGYDHPSGAAAFTVTSPSSGTIRITNQYVLSSDIEVFLQYRAMGTI